MLEIYVAPFLRDYGSPIAWAIAAVGWFISNHHANRRERRKEFRQEIDAITSILDGISSKFEKYYEFELRGKDALTLERKIKLLFKEIEYKKERIEKRKLSFKSRAELKKFLAKFEEFFDFSTGKYFESNDMLPEDRQQAQIETLHDKSQQVTESLHAVFLIEFDTK